MRLMAEMRNGKIVQMTPVNGNGEELQEVRIVRETFNDFADAVHSYQRNHEMNPDSTARWLAQERPELVIAVVEQLVDHLWELERTLCGADRCGLEERE